MWRAKKTNKQKPMKDEVKNQSKNFVKKTRPLPQLALSVPPFWWWTQAVFYIELNQSGFRRK